MGEGSVVLLEFLDPLRNALGFLFEGFLIFLEHFNLLLPGQEASGSAASVFHTRTSLLIDLLIVCTIYMDPLLYKYIGCPIDRSFLPEHREQGMGRGLECPVEDGFPDLFDTKQLPEEAFDIIR